MGKGRVRACLQSDSRSIAIAHPCVPKGPPERSIRYGRELAAK
jgi:hypothetical protein